MVSVICDIDHSTATSLPQRYGWISCSVTGFEGLEMQALCDGSRTDGLQAVTNIKVPQQVRHGSRLRWMTPGDEG